MNKCKKIQVTANTVKSSGKNAIVIQNSPSASVNGNQVKTAKNFGVYVFASNQALVQKNADSEYKEHRNRDPEGNPDQGKEQYS